MKQSIWTYRNPAPTKTLDTKGIMSLIAHYFKELINAVVEIIKATEGCEGLKETYKDGPMAVTRIMGVGMGGFGSRLTEDNPELLFVKKFHADLQASKLAWMFDSNMPIPAEIAEFVGKEDE